MTNLSKIVVYIKDEAMLEEAREMLERCGENISNGFNIHGVEDGTLHIWYSKAYKHWSTATVVFRDDTEITLTKLEQLLKQNTKA